MIDKVNKLILVHLPKTGGTSGASVLGATNNEPRGKHWTLKNYREKVPDFSNYHSFGFVRNPWARMAAWYRHILKRRPERKLSFERWIKKPSFFGMPIKEEPYFFLDGRFALDSVGRFENLEQDFKRIVYPFLGDIELPHRFNLGSDRNYADYYTPELIDIVAKRHQWVITEFRYSFDDLA